MPEGRYPPGFEFDEEYSAEFSDVPRSRAHVNRGYNHARSRVHEVYRSRADTTEALMRMANDRGLMSGYLVGNGEFGTGSEYTLEDIAHRGMPYDPHIWQEWL